MDHADTAFIKQATQDPNINNDQIVDIDLIWGDRPLRDFVPQPMDYAVASHVIEHVPDVIGWLLDLHGALKEDGMICLAIPDRRFTFDLRRPESTAGEMVRGLPGAAAAPPGPSSFRQGGAANSVSQGKAGRTTCSRERRPEARLPEAYRLARRVTSTTDYVDAHCWIFTPSSFLDVVERLSRLGLFPFAIEYFHATEYGDYEFYTRLRKSKTCRRSPDHPKRQGPAQGFPDGAGLSGDAAGKGLAQVLPESSYRPTMRELAQQRQRMADDEHRFYYEMAHQRAVLASERRRLDADFRYLQAWIDEVKSSTPWRITRPLRWLGRVLRSVGLRGRNRVGRPAAQCPLRTDSAARWQAYGVNTACRVPRLACKP